MSLWGMNLYDVDDTNVVDIITRKISLSLPILTSPTPVQRKIRIEFFGGLWPGGWVYAGVTGGMMMPSWVR